MRIRNKYLLIMAAVWGPCLALAATCYALVLRPQIHYRRQLQTEVAQAKKLYARAVEAAKPETQTRLTEQVECLEGRITDFLVGFEEAPTLAFEIGNLARETRLESFAMKPVNGQTMGPAVEREHLAEKYLSVSFQGGFPQFAAFLNALERHHPVVFVETFTINRPLEADIQPRVDMGLAILVERPREDTI
jgi:Tfp pilus assembly protein PilO